MTYIVTIALATVLAPAIFITLFSKKSTNILVYGIANAFLE